jgi:hypothetical protein
MLMKTAPGSLDHEAENPSPPPRLGFLGGALIGLGLVGSLLGPTRMLSQAVADNCEHNDLPH